MNKQIADQFVQQFLERQKGNLVLVRQVTWHIGWYYVLSLRAFFENPGPRTRPRGGLSDMFISTNGDIYRVKHLTFAFLVYFDLVSRRHRNVVWVDKVPQS